MMFGLHVVLAAAWDGFGEDFDTALDRMVEEVHAAEWVGVHCDASVGITTAEHDAVVEVDVAVKATGPEDAVAAGLTWLRTAAKAAGAATPGWKDAGDTSGHVALGVSEVVVTPPPELAA